MSQSTQATINKQTQLAQVDQPKVRRPQRKTKIPFNLKDYKLNAWAVKLKNELVVFRHQLSNYWFTLRDFPDVIGTDFTWFIRCTTHMMTHDYLLNDIVMSQNRLILCI